MTNIHRDLQYKALIWLQGRATARGIRAAIEVCVDRGWVADVVALFNLQSRFHDKFPDHRYDLSIKNLIYYAGLFEIKVSRSDFLKDFKRNNSQKQTYLPCNFHWIVCPRGMIKAEEVPKFWGLLEPCKTNRGLSEIKAPLFVEQSWPTLHDLATNLLWKYEFAAGAFWDRGNATRKFLEADWMRQEQKLEEDCERCF